MHTYHGFANDPSYCSWVRYESEEMFHQAIQDAQIQYYSHDIQYSNILHLEDISDDIFVEQLMKHIIQRVSLETRQKLLEEIQKYNEKEQKEKEQRELEKTNPTKNKKNKKNKGKKHKWKKRRR